MQYQGRSRNAQGGFALLNVLIASSVITIASLISSMFYMRAYARADFIKDKIQARMRAMSILSELRHEAIANPNLMAAELQRHADGDGFSPTLTIERDEYDQPVAPDHPASNNQRLVDGWRWFRRVRVDPHQDITSRDLRYVSVELYHSTGGRDVPGTLMASASSLIRTLNPSYPATQELDVYVLAMENVPGSSIDPHAAESMTGSALDAIAARNPGISFRVHWIRTMGYGRDDEYAPYVNHVRSATASTPWAHVYPHVTGSAASYNPSSFKARVNMDGVSTPLFRGDYAASELFVDANGNGCWEPSETFTDSNGNGSYDVGNPAPYALADAENHCMRHADAERRHAAREKAGDKELTWRLLLDGMASDPDRYADALIFNLHGSVLPVPAVRNYSDAAKDPAGHPGWRVVTHPETLVADRGTSLSSDPIALRVYAYKTLPPGALGHSILSTLGLTDEPFMTQREPLQDTNGNGVHDAGEAFVDWNQNTRWDDHAPITVQVRDVALADLASLAVERLPGGVNTGWPNVALEPYRPFEAAPSYPERFKDLNGDGIRQQVESFLDLDGNGLCDNTEPHQERDGDNTYSAADEPLQDENGNGRFDSDRPAEPFDDDNLNASWDPAEPYWDVNGNGQWDPPATPGFLRRPWTPVDGMTPMATAIYVDRYGEPFEDLDGDNAWDDAETFFDTNQNGVCDGGFERGEMWYRVEPHADGAVVSLFGTPLETPLAPTVGSVGGLGSLPGIGGIAPISYLYDLEYVPCPMPESGSTNPFARDLSSPLAAPKNTARWRVTVPSSALEARFAGAAEGGRLQVDTRIGTDLTTGTKWPVAHVPQNLSATYAYWVVDAEQVPFSERFQFLGDPRHAPYADANYATHTNRWFDDLKLLGLLDLSTLWPSVAGIPLADGWNGRAGGHDVPRQMQWLRTALVRSGAVLAGHSGRVAEAVSIGGDIGEVGQAVLMDGTPFGKSSNVMENTLSNTGTFSVAGGHKYTLSANGSLLGLRLGGAWWSKPWIGERFNDADYTQWRTSGNLTAGTGSAAGTYRRVLPNAVPLLQLPLGTEFDPVPSATGVEGLNTFLGARAAADQLQSGAPLGSAAAPTAIGAQALEALHLGARPYRVARNYEFASVPASKNPEFATMSAAVAGQVTARQVFIDAPGSAFGLAGLDLAMDDTRRRGGLLLGAAAEDEGLAAVIQVSIAASVETWFQGMRPTADRPTRPVPRIEIIDPSLATETELLTSVPVEWKLDWSRWSNDPYVSGLTPAPVGQLSEWRIVPMFSADEGRTWRNIFSGLPATPGELPRNATGAPDPVQTRPATVGETEALWHVSDLGLARGRYLVRVEALSVKKSQHFAWHMEAVFLRR